MSNTSSFSTANRSLKTRVNCHDCALSTHCLPVSLLEAEIEHLDSIIKRNRPLRKGEYLFRAGEAMQLIFAVRTGTLKTYFLDEEGVEQITGFHLPGELIGLDALDEEVYPSYAFALETALVCSIPFHQLEELAGSIPSLRTQLLRTLSREIHADQELQQLTKKSAEERLAAFLLNLSARFARRGLSAHSFILPMSRSDIGNYLGLTTETVSRLFTRYRQNGLIECIGREVRLKDMEGLHQLGHIASQKRA
ncbi:MAG: fumarate/nitrate reduction transcriptional regulator Fnr [Pseudomonas sp.]